MKNIAMRLFVFLSLVCSMTLFSVKSVAQEKVVIGYFSDQSQEDFDKKIKPVFEQFKGSCKNCEIVNLTPYDEKGSYSEKDLLEKIKNPSADVSIYFFSWNKKATPQNQDLIVALNEKTDAGKVIITPTGEAVNGEPGLALSRTVMGRVKDAVIIGEIMGNERILPQSYFGPEMLTAVRAPKEYLGQGYSPLYFATRFAAAWSKRKPLEWLQHFKTKKAKSRKIWLDTEDLCGR